MEQLVPQKEIRYTRFNGVSLFTDTKPGDFATFTWGARDGRPRITVYTSKEYILVDSKMDYDKIIIAPFGLVDAVKFLDICLKIVSTAPTKTARVECLNNKFKDRNRTKEIITQAVIEFSKDEQGFKFTAWKDPEKKFVFYIKPSAWHKYSIDGNPIPQAQQEVLYVTTYLNTIKQFIGEEIVRVKISSSTVEQDVPTVTD